MKSICASLFLFILLLMGYCAKAQTYPNFENEIQQLSSKNYPQDKVESLFRKYNHLLFFFNPYFLTEEGVNADSVPYYPLEYFKNSNLYQSNIDILLQDTTSYKFNLGYFLAAAANDKSKIPQIEAIMSRAGYKNYWAANMLIVLDTKNIQPIIKTIVNLKDQDNISYLATQFLKMPPAVLNSFAIDNINSKHAILKHLAISTMANGEFTKTKDSLLRNVVRNDDQESKYVAISILSNNNAPNMLDLLRPHLNNNDLRGISLQALSTSRTTEDEKYFDELSNQAPVDSDILEALFQSNQDKNIRKWLKLLREKRVANDYSIYMGKKSIITNEVYFDDICETITKSPNTKQISKLFDYFSNRNDDNSIRFLMKTLANRDLDRTNFYYIVRNLTGKNNELIKQSLPELMKNTTIQDVVLVNLLIEYQNNDYHDKIRTWLNSGDLEFAYRTLCNKYLNGI